MPVAIEQHNAGTLTHFAPAKCTLPEMIAKRMSVDDRSRLVGAMSGPHFCLEYPEFRYRNADVTLRVTLPAGEKSDVVKPAHWVWYNFARWRAGRILAAARGPLRAATAREVVGWLDESLAMRNAIVTLNRGLSFHVVRKLRNSPLDPDDAISEADSGLIRAVEYFDVRKGIRFSCYACRAIWNRLRRASRPARHTDGLDGDKLGEEEETILPADVQAVRRVLRENAAGLTPLEHRVLKMCFGLDERCNVRRENDWFYGAGANAWHVGEEREDIRRRLASATGLTIEGVASVRAVALGKLRAALN